MQSLPAVSSNAGATLSPFSKKTRFGSGVILAQDRSLILSPFLLPVTGSVGETWICNRDFFHIPVGGLMVYL